MSEQYTLITERMGLILLCKEDIQYLENLDGDPVVKKFFPNGARSRAETENMIERFMNNYQKDNLPSFVVFNKLTHEFMGRCGFGRFETGEIEVGYVLHQQYWRQGYATEILEVLLMWARANIHSNEIIALATRDNTGSIRVMQKCGMQYYKTEHAKGDECVFYKINLR